MDHHIELKDCNIVIIANNFNTSIINTVWLYKNNIFSEKEIQGSTSLPIMVEVQAKDYIFHLIPDRLQFSVNPMYEAAKELLISKIGKLIQLLPHTPFSAAGLNFTYHVKPSDEDISKLSRSLFCNNQSKLFNNLTTDDVRFGGYFSKNLIGTRFRLDAKPITISKKAIKEEFLQFSYNFNINLNVDDSNTTKIIDLFNKWDEAKKICNKLTSNINAEGSK